MVKNPSRAIYKGSYYGPIFGAGHDIYIADNIKGISHSRSTFGVSYSVPSGVQNSHTILAGTQVFAPDEVEVFYFDWFTLKHKQAKWFKRVMLRFSFLLYAPKLYIARNLAQDGRCASALRPYWLRNRIRKCMEIRKLVQIHRLWTYWSPVPDWKHVKYIVLCTLRIWVKKWLIRSKFTYFLTKPLSSFVVSSMSSYIVLKSCRSHAKYSLIRG